MPGLREQLMGETLPEFVLTLPPGWIRQEPTDDMRKQMLDAAKRRLMSVHRPDLYAQLTPLVMRAFQEMSRNEVLAFFTPGPDTPDDQYLPASLTASVLRGPDGTTLDSAMAELIRNQGATALGDDKRILRREQEDVQTLQDERIPTTTVAYYIPVPGSGRKRALQFTLVISHDDADDRESVEWLDGLKALFDAHLSTFSWVRPA